MRVQLSIAIILLFASLSGIAAGASSVPKHSIVGTWTFTIPAINCTETYSFRADGTASATSAEEIAESTYTISAEPSAGGTYKLVTTIVKDNGKKDCSGGITERGQKTTNYIRFDPSGEELTVCQTESLEGCFGPVQRVRPKTS